MPFFCGDRDHNHNLNKNSKIEHFCEDCDHSRGPQLNNIEGHLSLFNRMTFFK